jgi:hypothetical protein
MIEAPLLRVMAGEDLAHAVDNGPRARIEVVVDSEALNSKETNGELLWRKPTPVSEQHCKLRPRLGWRRPDWAPGLGAGSPLRRGARRDIEGMLMHTTDSD